MTGSKVKKPDFLRKFLFFLKFAKWVINGSKIRLFRVFQKFWHHFLLKIIENKRFYDCLFSYANLLSGKMPLQKLWLKMLLSNQVERFFDHIYLWKESINILDFLDEIGTSGRYQPRLLLLVGCHQECAVTAKHA